jgi:hypothetical protein
MRVVICEVYTVEAESVEDGVQQAKNAASGRDSVVYGSDGLNTLAHPIHLQDVQNKVGYIEPIREAAPVEVSYDSPPTEATDQ